MADQDENIKPAVTIIIPCYNYGQYLPETLQSLQQQVCTGWECLVIDDGSTDQTREVVEQFAGTDQRIGYHYQQNQGQPAARNTGLRMARGRYIQFLDADDRLQAQKLSTHVSYLNTHPETDIVYGDVRYFTNRQPVKLIVDRWNEKSTEGIPKISGHGTPLIAAFARENILELGCALFRKEALDEIGLFDISLKGVEDYDFCFRAALLDLSFTFLSATNSYCLMRHHAESYSKQLVEMYKKELMLRKAMARRLKPLADPTPYRINATRFNARLRRLLDLHIDRTIKGERSHTTTDELRWIYRTASLKQNLYFFPRLAKAYLLTGRNPR